MRKELKGHIVTVVDDFAFLLDGKPAPKKAIAELVGISFTSFCQRMATQKLKGIVCLDSLLAPKMGPMDRPRMGGVAAQRAAIARIQEIIDSSVVVDRAVYKGLIIDAYAGWKAFTVDGKPATVGMIERMAGLKSGVFWTRIKAGNSLADSLKEKLPEKRVRDRDRVVEVEDNTKLKCVGASLDEMLPKAVQIHNQFLRMAI